MQYIESDTLGFVAVLALVGWALWLHHRARQQHVELRQSQVKLSLAALEKFSEAREFLTFLESREGQVMLGDDRPLGKTRDKTIIRMMQIGTLLLFIGAGLFLCATRYHGAQSPDLTEVLAVLNLTGTVSVSAGVGLYVVAIVTTLWERRVGVTTNR